MLTILSPTLTWSSMTAHSIFLSEKAHIPKLSEEGNHHVHSPFFIFFFSPRSSESLLGPVSLVLEVLDMGAEGLEGHITVITQN